MFFLFLACCLLADATSSRTDDLAELLVTAEERGIISNDQLQSLLSLASERREGTPATEQADHPTSSLFVTMYNQLTLLNVLYFGGSLLIIGAYSLLMNIAWEHCSSTGISLVMLAQSLAFGLTGIALWNTSTYQFLGGL